MLAALHYLMQGWGLGRGWGAKLEIHSPMQLEIVNVTPRGAQWWGFQCTTRVRILPHLNAEPRGQLVENSRRHKASGNLQSPSRLGPSLGPASRRGYFTFPQPGRAGGGWNAPGREQENGCSQRT